MAQIVAAIGTPHSPHHPAQIKREGDNCPARKLYGQIAEELRESSPDILVIYADDHFNSFFLDNFPIFAVGIADETRGPNDQTVMPSYHVGVERGLATHIRRECISAGFDIALVQDFTVDHATMVPLHFLTPDAAIPIVPFFINTLAPPLPSSQRCFALGKTVAAAIRGWPQHKRVAVIGSGSFSLEIGGPRVPPGARAGTPDPQWVLRVADHLEHGRHDALVNEITTARLARAGNIAGEVLNWIAMLGAVERNTPSFIASEAEHGHSYAAWRL